MSVFAERSYQKEWGRVLDFILRFVLFLTLSILGSAIPIVAPAQAEVDATETNRTVFVDSVEIVGNTDTNDEVLKAALDIPVGVGLSRETLDDRIQAGKQRLEALGYFRSVDIALVKGKSRGRFLVVLTVDPERSFYFGVSMKRHESEQNAKITKLKHSSNTYQVYGGSRNLLGTGLRGELSLRQWRGKTTSDAFNFDMTMSGTQASLYDPALFGTTWFTGIAAAYLTTKFNSHSGFLGTTYSSQSKGDLKFAYAVFGRRIGLLAAAAGASRFMSKTRSKSNNRDFATTIARDSSTNLFAQLDYSDKTFLTTVEPGTLLSLSYNRATSPEWEPPVVMGIASHTSIAWPRHGFTPMLIFQYEKMRVSGDFVLSRSYDGSIKYNYVATKNLTFEAAYGEHRLIDKNAVNGEVVSYPSRRKKIAVYYTSSGFLVSIALLYGENGLEQDFEQLLFPNGGGLLQ